MEIVAFPLFNELSLLIFPDVAIHDFLEDRGRIYQSMHLISSADATVNIEQREDSGILNPYHFSFYLFFIFT